MGIPLLIVLGLAAGTLGSMLGLGGGFLVVPALILIQGMGERMATGTSVAIIVPAMVVALWRRGGAGHVDWRIAGFVAIGAVVGAFVGSKISESIDPTLLRRMFAGILVLLAGVLAFKK